MTNEELAALLVFVVFAFAIGVAVGVSIGFVLRVRPTRQEQYKLGEGNER